MVKEDVVAKGRGRGGTQPQKQQKGRGMRGAGQSVFGGQDSGRIPGPSTGQPAKKPGRQTANSELACGRRRLKHCPPLSAACLVQTMSLFRAKIRSRCWRDPHLCILLFSSLYEVLFFNYIEMLFGVLDFVKLQPT